MLTSMDIQVFTLLLLQIIFSCPSGPKAAYYAANNLHEILQSQGAYSRQEYPIALKEALAQVDKAILSRKWFLHF